MEKKRPAVRRHTPISNPSVWRTCRSAGAERKSLRFRCHLTGTPFQVRGPTSLVKTEVSWPTTRSAWARSPKYLHGCRFSSAGGSVSVMIAIRRVSKNQPAPLHRPASEPGRAGIRLNRLNNLGTVPRVECPRGPSQASLRSAQFGLASCATARRSQRGRLDPSRNCGGFRAVDMALAFQGVPSLRCHTTTQAGLAHRYDESDVRRIRAFDLDFLLQCGLGVLDGEILRAARYGVWSFQQADEPRY